MKDTKNWRLCWPVKLSIHSEKIRDLHHAYENFEKNPNLTLKSQVCIMWQSHCSLNISEDTFPIFLISDTVCWQYSNKDSWVYLILSFPVIGVEESSTVKLGTHVIHFSYLLHLDMKGLRIFLSLFLPSICFSNLNDLLNCVLAVCANSVHQKLSTLSSFPTFLLGKMFSIFRFSGKISN